MADTIVAGAATNIGVLYGPEQFRELILEPLLSSPDLNQILTITNDIKSDVDVLFSSPFEKVTKIDTGCGTTPTTPQMGVEKLSWRPVPLEAWIQECASDFEGTFMRWGLANGYNALDLRQAVIKIRSGMGSSDIQTLGYWNEFVQDKMEEAIRRDIYRIGYFGNPAITAAQLTAGSADVANYNQLLGLWPQIIALATGTPAVHAYTIQANQGATLAAQALPFGEATKIFTALLFGAGTDQRLRFGEGTPIIQCTQSVADNWAIERQSQNLETSFKLAITGLVGPRFNNVEIVPMPEWDRRILADFVVGGKANLPHRAVLTTKENMQLGFDNYDAAMQVMSWFNPETKYTHMRGNWKMDAKVMRPYLTRGAW